MRNPKERLTALFHHIAPDALRAACFGLKNDASAGVDGVTRVAHDEGLDVHLLNLHSRLHRGGALLLVDAKRVIPAVPTRFQPLTGLFHSHWGLPIGHLL